ncbi:MULTISPECIES: ATP-dependent Clp protease proteolytic subunit [Klebsiella pneumoniae complex]|nr:ATP-dependent Clp protease proteolytic subunit [Klebsiella variicola]
MAYLVVTLSSHLWKWLCNALLHEIISSGFTQKTFHFMCIMKMPIAAYLWETEMIHTVHFMTDVTVASVSSLMDVCLKAISSPNQPASEIRIYISSKGGDTVAGFTAYNFLKSLPVKVKTHNLSNVESIANVIFMAGSERFANPLSRFLLHPLHWGFAAPQADHLRLREWAACLDDDLQRFVQVMNIEALAVAPDEQIDWANLITSATIIDPGRATELGIIQNVEAATIPTDSIRWWVL